MKQETIAVHAGLEMDPTTRALNPPIYLSTTFARDAAGEYGQGYIYGRSENPTRHALESCLTQLEGGAETAVFASGMAAITAVFQSLQHGDHAIVPTDVYYGTVQMLRQVMDRWGLQLTAVDMTDLQQIKDAIQPNTRLIWIETPSNPQLKIVDINGVVQIANSAGIRTACDATWTTPIITQPLQFGVDLVVHATTKYLGGHGDVLGGAVICRAADALFSAVRTIQTSSGAIPSPFDCWLLLRGIRSLPYRMRAHTENATKVAHFLDNHPRVVQVNYPGLPGHPGHDIAAAQMRYCGGMLSFLVDGDDSRAMAVANSTQLFAHATSLGSTESLIEHRASVEGPDTGTPGTLLRLSVGLEHPDDLIADLAQALEDSARP